MKETHGMKRTAWSTGMPYGTAGFGASSCWSATPGTGLDRHANVRVMVAKPVITAAQRPLGLAGGTTG